MQNGGLERLRIAEAKGILASFLLEEFTDYSYKHFMKKEKSSPFDSSEIDASIDKMADEKKVMRKGDTVFFLT